MQGQALCRWRRAESLAEAVIDLVAAALLLLVVTLLVAARGGGGS